jgi:FKBP-type peptidyl-prolyl cis-trans isomerase SlpA
MNPLLRVSLCGLLINLLIVSAPLRAEDAPPAIGEGKQVKLHYTLKVDGKVMDQTAEDKPLEFVYGGEGLIPGFMANIEGLHAGEDKSFEVKPEEGYGPHHPEGIITVERTKLPPGELTVGMTFTTTNQEGGPMRGTVSKIEGENVILDFNHPLAGKTLLFEVHILEVI